MAELNRIAWLAIRFNWTSKAKLVLLVILVAVGMSVFLVVTELSRVSSEGLDDAISEDVGETGTYMIALSSSFGLDPVALSHQVDAAVAPYASSTPLTIQVLPPITPDCPPYEELGPQSILILRDSAGTPADIPFGEGLPLDTQICFDGQRIPATAVYIPTQSEQAKWGAGLVVDTTYERIANLATNQPITYRFSVITDQQRDQRNDIETAVKRQLEIDALKHGVDIGETVFVLRIDTGESIRSASNGIKLVYTIIGWGVLILGGLGLLVSELIVVRDRTWFFGLARAVGARNRHIAALIFADVLVVLIAGTVLALVISVAIQPAADSFGQDAFQVNVRLIQLSTIPKLVAGALLVLLLAGVYPAYVATRQDPLDILEPKST